MVHLFINRVHLFNIDPNQAQSEEMMDNHVEEQVVSDLELEV